MVNEMILAMVRVLVFLVLAVTGILAALVIRKLIKRILGS